MHVIPLSWGLTQAGNQRNATPATLFQATGVPHPQRTHRLLDAAITQAKWERHQDLAQAMEVAGFVNKLLQSSGFPPMATVQSKYDASNAVHLHGQHTNPFVPADYRIILDGRQDKKRILSILSRQPGITLLKDPDAYQAELRQNRARGLSTVLEEYVDYFQLETDKIPDLAHVRQKVFIGRFSTADNCYYQQNSQVPAAFQVQPVPHLPVLTSSQLERAHKALLRQRKQEKQNAYRVAEHLKKLTGLSTDVQLPYNPQNGPPDPTKPVQYGLRVFYSTQAFDSIVQQLNKVPGLLLLPDVKPRPPAYRPQHFRWDITHIKELKNVSQKVFEGGFEYDNPNWSNW